MILETQFATLAMWGGVMLGTGACAGVIAGLLGVGGGIVIVPVLFLFMDVMGVDPAVRMHVAAGTSLAIIIPTAIRSARAHLRHGAVDVPLLRSLGPWLFAGVVCGAALAGVVSGVVLTAVFAGVALVVAVNLVLQRDGRAWIAGGLPGTLGRALLGGVIGALSTMMGIGGGTLTVPTLAAFGYPVHRAVGTAAAVGAIIAIPGTIGFVIAGIGEPMRPPLSLGYVNLLGLALIFPMSMLLAPLGAKLAHKLPPRLLRLAFATFLTASAVRMLAEVL
jgi:uncharacterized membrane protein YfcA